MSKHDEILLRRAKVAEMMEGELTFREMAIKAGVGLGTIARDITAVRREAADRKRAAADNWLERELDELDWIQTIAVEIAETEEDNSTRLMALDRRLKVGERRAKLLGLDAPERHEDMTPGAMTPSAAAAVVREVFRNNVGAGASATSEADGAPAGDARDVPERATGA